MRKLYPLFQSSWFQIFLITLLGAVMRLWGILHGFQENFLYHWDSVQTLSQVWPFYLGLDWTEKSYSGPIYNFLIIYVLKAFEIFFRFLGYQINWSLELIGSAASLTTAFLGTATIPIIFVLGRRAYNKTTGILAAAFLSVCPLHSFHSHYPYRDVPMVFFLVITLYFCVIISEKPSLLNLTLGGLAALVTAAMKPAGMVVVAPFLVASVIGMVRTKKIWFVISFCFVLLVVGFFSSTLNFRGNSFSYIFAQFSQSEITFIPASIEIIQTLIQWIGLPYVIAISISIGYGLCRFRLTDIIFLVFLTSAFIVLATAYYIDERFMIFLMPCGLVMLGRAITDFWKIFSKVKYIKIIPFLVVGGLLLNAFLQSAWQGMLFSIPDTRFLAGKWAASHLSKETRIATEAYYPLGINEWPNVFFFDPLQPVEEEAKKTELFVTSSAEHQRYFDLPYRFRNSKKKLFFETLGKQGLLVKNISLNSLGFIHPTIEVYSALSFNDKFSLHLHKPFVISVPRPYDASWNEGVSFLDRGPLDRDDRTIQLGWGHRHIATLVSPKTGQEMVVFMVNGSEKSVVKVRVGFMVKIRTLKPGEFHILTYRPNWSFPKKPALYRFDAGLPEGKKVLIQLRCGNREIGEAYSKWGDYEKAVTYLKRAMADDPNNPEVGLRLSINYEKLGKSAEAWQIVKNIKEKDPDFIDMLLSLGRSDLSTVGWEQLFQGYTGLKPSLLTYALSQEFNIDKAFPSRSGEINEDCRASGGKTITYEKTGHKPDEVMHGPYIYLDQGAFRAGFFIRTWDVKGTEPLAVIKVLADDHVISTLSVAAKDLKSIGGPFKEIQIPFVNSNPRAEIKFQVFATGSASFAINKIRIEPDLRKIFQEKFLNLKTIAGDNPLVEDKKTGLN